MGKKYQPIFSEVITSKSFRYEKGDCKLNFSLKIDDSTELENFKECLESAVKDIDEILEEKK